MYSLKKLLAVLLCVTAALPSGAAGLDPEIVREAAPSFWQIKPAEAKPELQFFFRDEIPVKHDNTVEEIVEFVKNHPNDSLSDEKEPTFVTEPRLTAPYEAGELSGDDLNDALNTLKVLRFLAGLPYEDIEIDEWETTTAQHKAVLMAVSGYSHHPEQPEDMSDKFYETAADWNSECIAAASWKASLSSRVLSWVTDTGDNNIERAGHRMILFNPGATKFGFGYANNEAALWPNLYSAHIDYEFDVADSYIAWPNAGDFPIQYFAESMEEQTLVQPWSLTLGADYREPDRDEITLTLTRKRDNKEWVFNKDTPLQTEDNFNTEQMHLSVNDSDILFRPDVPSLGSIEDGDVFNVTLTGIEHSDGRPATLSYDINFFDLDAAMDIAPDTEPETSTVIFSVKYNGAAVEGAAVTVDGQTLMTDANGAASVQLENNKTYGFTVAVKGFDTVTGSVDVGENGVLMEIELTESEAPSDTPGIDGAEIVVNVNSERILVSVEGVELPDECRLIAVGSNSDGQLIACAEGEDGTAVLPVDGVETLKIFVWESLESMRPLCPATTVEL